MKKVEISISCCLFLFVIDLFSSWNFLLIFTFHWGQETEGREAELHMEAISSLFASSRIFIYLGWLTHSLQSWLLNDLGRPYSRGGQSAIWNTAWGLGGTPERGGFTASSTTIGWCFQSFEVCWAVHYAFTSKAWLGEIPLLSLYGLLDEALWLSSIQNWKDVKIQNQTCRSHLCQRWGSTRSLHKSYKAGKISRRSTKSRQGGQAHLISATKQCWKYNSPLTTCRCMCEPASGPPCK